MTSGGRTTQELDHLIAELDSVLGAGGSSEFSLVVRDLLVGIRDHCLRGVAREDMERQVGALFRVLSDSELFGTPMMSRILTAVNEAIRVHIHQGPPPD